MTLFPFQRLLLPPQQILRHFQYKFLHIRGQPAKNRQQFLFVGRYCAKHLALSGPQPILVNGKSRAYQFYVFIGEGGFIKFDHGQSCLRQANSLGEFPLFEPQSLADKPDSVKYIHFPH